MHCMLKLKKATADSIVMAARNTYPDEFLALLGAGSGDGVIDELVVIPAIYGKNFASLRIDLIPFDSSVKGSVHSHPSENNSPSSADLGFFPALGEIHLIIAYPFNYGTLRAFDAKGNDIEFEIIE